MTATKRRRPVFFAIACALVLIGGSLEAAEPERGERGSWDLNIKSFSGTPGTSAAGRESQNQVSIDFQIVGAQTDVGKMKACLSASNYHTCGGSLGVLDCGASEILSEQGSGLFRANFVVPVRYKEYCWIQKTVPSMAVWILGADGKWTWSGYVFGLPDLTWSSL